MAAFATPEINREIGRDPIQPCREARARFELLEVLIRANKGFLRQFQRIILIMDHRQRDADHPPLIALDQSTEGIPVSLPCPFDEFGFVAVLTTWVLNRLDGGRARNSAFVHFQSSAVSWAQFGPHLRSALSGTRSSAAPSISPGRPPDLTKTLFDFEQQFVMHLEKHLASRLGVPNGHTLSSPPLSDRRHCPESAC